MKFKQLKDNERTAFQLLNMECLSLAAMCLRVVLQREINNLQWESFLAHLKVIDELVSEILEVHSFNEKNGE